MCALSSPVRNYGATPVFPLLFSPAAPSLRGFRPRLPGARARLRLLSIAATNAAELKRAADQLGSRLITAKAAASGSPSIRLSEMRRAVFERLDADEPIVAHGPEGAHARMRPFLRPRRDPAGAGFSATWRAAFMR